MRYQIEYHIRTDDNKRVKKQTTFIVKTDNPDEALRIWINKYSKNIRFHKDIGITCKAKNRIEYKQITTDKTEWMQDDSGIYTLINWILPDDKARIDVMSCDHDPIITFIGDPDDVRKQLMRFLSDQNLAVSLEHAAYIGAELERADTERIDYVQD